MDNTFSMEQAKEVLDRGVQEAQELVQDPSKMEELFGQLQEKLQTIPGVGDLMKDIPLTIELVKSYITQEYTEISPKVIFSLVSAFIYLLKKKDLIRDNIPLLGYADDLAVLGVALKAVEPELEAFAAWKRGEAPAQDAAADIEVPVRAGGDMLQAGAVKEEALEVLKNRRAIRKFKAEQIREEELQMVLEAGTFAPTGAGTQGVQIVAVQSPENVAAVDALNAKVLDNPSAHPYYGAPTILLIFETEACRTHELDGAAVCTNMLNAAYAVGLGSCWIHRCKQMFELEEGKELLRKWGLPETLSGVASIALGYADCEHPQAKPRKEDYVVRV